MRILFVAMSQSIHTSRWINQLADQGWDLHLFPSWELSVHPLLRNVTIHGFKDRPEEVPLSVNLKIRVVNSRDGYFKRQIVGKFVRIKKFRKIGFGKVFDWIGKQKGFEHLLPNYYSDQERCIALVDTIRKIKPDIVHSLEIQHAGYLTLNARKIIGDGFPTWIVTNWGADIHYFGEIPEHAEKIREVLEACDYYSCECKRDADLGRKFGFKGEILPVLTNTGGFDFDFIAQLCQSGPTSDRKLILIKGYQGWVYRALIALQAVEMCTDIIKEKGYRIAVYLASVEVSKAAKKLRKKAGIPVELVPYMSHEKILGLHGQARVSIGLSMSDAISTSFLEAIIMGSFPIQSDTSCANEWVTSGETGFLVPPEDPQKVAEALRRALTDDDLVNRAAEINRNVLRQRLDYKKVKETVISTYLKIYNKEPLL